MTSERDISRVCLNTAERPVTNHRVGAPTSDEHGGIAGTRNKGLTQRQAQGREEEHVCDYNCLFQPHIKKYIKKRL